MAWQFDCPRSAVLNYEFPLLLFPTGHATGSTNSTWAERWTTLQYWTHDQIASEFNHYWNSTVSAADKDELIGSQAFVEWTIASLRSQQQLATDESHIRQRFEAGISWAHRIAISSDNNQRAPSDPHSTIQVYQNIVFGEPDYLLQNPITFEVTGVCEAKSPWNIGPSEIDDVISGTLVDVISVTNAIGHASATNAGRLAVQQVYGYMCWNSFPLGILTTMAGFVFLKRQDGGVLYLSRMYGSHRDLEPYQYAMPRTLGPPNNFTISHMLYWFTAMTELARRIPESRLQQAIQVMNAQRASAQAPQSTGQYAQPVPANYMLPQQPQGQAPGPPGYTMFGLQPTEDIRVYFKPWARENHCGGRAWKGLILPERAPVVLKCWDSYKHNDDAQKTEADTYLKLWELWGICVPKFIALGTVGFCHVIILEHIEVN